MNLLVKKSVLLNAVSETDIHLILISFSILQPSRNRTRQLRQLKRILDISDSDAGSEEEIHGASITEGCSQTPHV